MFTFEKSIFIKRPPQEVFDFMGDPTNDPQWRDSAISAEWTSEGSPGVGSTVRSVDKILGRQMESTSEIIAWDRPHLWGQKSVGGPMPYEMTVKFEVKEQGTQLTVSGNVEPGGFFKIAEGLVRKQLEKQFETDLNGLKRVLEAG
ncbi:MAG: SRPBCC family protein [Anaerolineales bacterium]|nr:MAG: SRPBCC family protein [Anaerolineales bacterium]